MLNFSTFQPNNSFLQGYFGSSLNYGGSPYSTYGCFGGASSASSSSSLDTEEKRQKRLQQLDEQIKAKKEELAPVDDLIKRADKAKVNKDGTYTEKETFEDYKKQPWWKKALRATGNMLDGTMKMVEGFIGLERDQETGKRKFKPLKLLKNVAIAAALVGATCIPVVGPFISFGLLSAGVLTGVGGMTKGIIQAVKANKEHDLEALDHAFQDVGQGAAIGVSSAVGLRGLGKGLSVANEMNAAKGLTTFTQSTSKTGIGQAFLDMTVNAFKATKAASVSSKAAALEAGGFWKGWGNNLKAKLPKFGKKAEELSKDKLTELNKNIDSRLNKIEGELSDPALASGSEKEQILNKEFDMLMNQKQELANARTSADWRKLNPNQKNGSNEAYNTHRSLRKIRLGKKVTINGQEIKVTPENIDSIRSLSARAEWYSNDIASVSKMQQPWYSRISGIYGPDQDAKIIRKIGYWIKTPFSFIFKNVLGVTFKPYQLISKSPAAAWYNFESTFIVPQYTEGMLTGMLGMGDRQMTDIEPDSNGQVAALNTDIVKARKAKRDKIQEELNKLENEQRDIMMA